jgi:hypothetical protein
MENAPDDSIPPLPWDIQGAANKLLIGSVSPDQPQPQTVDQIVFEMEFEDGVVNRHIEYARAEFIVAAVNKYYRRP